jgi:hypothetical protein
MPVMPSISGQAGNKSMAAPNVSINPLERQSQLAQARSYRAANAAAMKGSSGGSRV